jgi:hypothetical protein
MRAGGPCVKRDDVAVAEKWPSCAGRGSLEGVKTLFLLFVVCGLVVAALFAPLDRTRGVAKDVARQAAHGMRRAWDWVVADEKAPAKAPQKKAAARRVSREGIVAQPPKEKLSPADKSALDSLMRR